MALGAVSLPMWTGLGEMMLARPQNYEGTKKIMTHVDKPGQNPADLSTGYWGRESSTDLGGQAQAKMLLHGYIFRRLWTGELYKALA